MNKFFLIIFGLFFYLPLTAQQSLDILPKTIYAFTPEPIDVVIPSTAKDLEILESCIDGIRNNCIGLRRIIVVSKEPLSFQAEWFDEKLYPFSKFDVALYLCKGDAERANQLLSEPGSRVGWYYQQLLKFYAPFVIPDISSNVLILDSDTVFLKPTTFLNDAWAGLYVPNHETYYNMPYLHHACRLIPGFIRIFPNHSGITHHMLFQRCVLEELFGIVSGTHHIEFWKAFCLCVDSNDLHPMGTGASEYEIYFNFVFARTNQVEIRPLNRIDVSSLSWLEHCRERGFDFLSCHDWMRQH